MGLGSDFDGISRAPVGLDGVDKWPNLTRALLEEGDTAAKIRKMYGENTLRLMPEVERVARSTRLRALPIGAACAYNRRYGSRLGK